MSAIQTAPSSGNHSAVNVTRRNLSGLTRSELNWNRSTGTKSLKLPVNREENLASACRVGVHIIRLRIPKEIAGIRFWDPVDPCKEIRMITCSQSGLVVKPKLLGIVL